MLPPAKMHPFSMRMKTQAWRKHHTVPTLVLEKARRGPKTQKVAVLKRPGKIRS